MVERLLAVLLFLGVVTAAGVLWEREADLHAEIAELREAVAAADASMAEIQDSVASARHLAITKVDLDTVESRIESGSFSVPWRSIKAPPGCGGHYAFWVKQQPPPPLPGFEQVGPLLGCARVVP